MILIDLPAHAQCSEEGCAETMPVQLALLTGGTLGFRATAPGWQVGHEPTLGAPFLARCPKHARTVGVVTDLAAVRNAKGMH